MIQASELPSELRDLVEAAMAENWSVFDQLLEKHRNNGKLLSFARTVLQDSVDPTLLDVAASAFEVTDAANVTPDDIKLLVKLISSRSNNYAEQYEVFRAACALRKHAYRSLDTKAQSDVNTVLEFFANDKDSEVNQLAKHYLDSER